MLILEDLSLLLYCTVMIFICGTVLGSFLNCAAWRIAHQESVLHGRSHCPVCGHPLGALDLVPIFSWLFLKGKCRYCQAPVSVRYPLTELFMGSMFVLALFRFDLSPLLFRNLFLLCCLFTLSLVDLEIYEIPDGALLAAALVWLLYGLIFEKPAEELFPGLLAGFLIAGAVLLLSLVMDKVLHRESMGGGDIKLIFVCCLYLGLAAGLFMLILSCIFGLIAAAAGKRKGNSPADNQQNEGDAVPYGAFPFGPSISLAAWFMLTLGAPFVTWYLSLLG